MTTKMNTQWKNVSDINIDIRTARRNVCFTRMNLSVIRKKSPIIMCIFYEH